MRIWTRTAAHAGRALSLTPPEENLVRAAAGALGGLASWTTGDLAGALAAYNQTVQGLQREGSLADVLGCCIAVGDILCTQGRLSDATRTYDRALELATPMPSTGPLRGSADMHVALAAVLLERDDLPAAAEHLAVSERLGESNGLPQNPYRWRVVTARLRAAEGDLDRALALLDEADRVYVGDYSPNVRPVPATRARLRLRRGELAEAEAWAAERNLTSDDELSYLREYEHVTLARLLLARYDGERDATDLDAALNLLDRLLAEAEKGARGASVIEILVLLALARQRRGDVPAALESLQRAVTLAQPEGYVRVFTDEGPPMAALLQLLAKRPSAPGSVRRLLATTTRIEHTSVPSALVDPLSQRELDVLRWLGTDLSGPDIARRLSVSLNTVRTHTKSIYAKLGVSSRRAAVRRAHELDLLAGQQHR